jgi:hypothetical protein
MFQSFSVFLRIFPHFSQVLPKYLAYLIALWVVQIVAQPAAAQRRSSEKNGMQITKNYRDRLTDCRCGLIGC